MNKKLPIEVRRVGKAKTHAAKYTPVSVLKRAGHDQFEKNLHTSFQQVYHVEKLVECRQSFQLQGFKIYGLSSISWLLA